jgi:hypothetical protein
MVGFPLMVSCGVRGDELHMSEPRWAAINRDEARLGATNRDQATRARTPYIVISLFPNPFQPAGDPLALWSAGVVVRQLQTTAGMLNPHA